MKVRTRLLLAALLSVGIALLNGCAARSVNPVTRTEFALDTACTISVYGKPPAGAIDHAFELLNSVGARMTIDRPSGELITVNAAAGLHPVAVDPELYRSIQVGLHFSRLTHGVFDLTIGPLTKLWGIGTGGSTVPPEAKIKEALALVNYHDLVLNPSNHTVYLKRRHMVIDLGAIAKGYAGDRVREYLERVGVRHAIIDLGGNVVTIGSKPDGKPWRIGIQAPSRARGAYIGIVTVSDKAVVSSGQYERFFTVKGTRYGHILSTTTGFPVDNGVASTTIIAKSSTDGDALSTAVFALGEKKGLALVNSLPGVEAIILTTSKKVYLSRGLATSFRLTDPSYTLVPQISLPTGSLSASG